MNYKKILLVSLLSGMTLSAQAAVIKIDGTNGIATWADVDGDSVNELVINSDKTLLNTNQYILTGLTYVTSGATLTIEPGTIVRGKPSSGGGIYDPGTLVITRNGQILAEGTATQPIIFTTAAVDEDANGVPDAGITTDYKEFDGGTMTAADFLDADPVNNPLPPHQNFLVSGHEDPETNGDVQYRGLWGGIVILGNAPTNVGSLSGSSLVAKSGLPATDDAGRTVGYGCNRVEGFPLSDEKLTIYGGNKPNDDSGILSYISIRHGGTKIAAANEINGLTMGGVGYGTTIDHIEVYCNDDDGYEWFGGTVFTSHLLSLFNNDDSFDIDEGFTGIGQFWCSIGLDDGRNSNRAAEHDGVTTGINVNGMPETYVTVYNATYIGTGTTLALAGQDDGDQACFQVRDQFGGAYYNSIFSDFSYEAFDIETDGYPRLQAGDVVFKSCMWYRMAYNRGTPGSFKSVGTDWIGDKATTAGYQTALQDIFNNTNSGTGCPSGTFTNNTTTVDAYAIRRIQGKFNRRTGFNLKPAGTGATSNLVSYSSTFVSPVGYKGAFAPSGSAWTAGWSVASLNSYILD
jgi:hypothetical protein